MGLRFLVPISFIGAVQRTHGERDRILRGLATLCQSHAFILGAGTARETVGWRRLVKAVLDSAG
jgi:hypothetical protein